MYVTAQTNHQITKYATEIKLTRWFVYEWGKHTWQKSDRVILRSTLPRIHYYQNKRLQVKESYYFIPTYSWTLTPIPNWTCSIMTISHFQCTAPNTWLTNRCTDPSSWFNHQLEKDVGCKVLQFITRWRSRNSLDTKPYGVQTQQLLQEIDELGQILSPVTIYMNKTLLHTCATVQPLMTLKIILIYIFRVVRKESLNTYYWMKNNSEKLSFINLDR